jgi:hypothetical protein
MFIGDPLREQHRDAEADDERRVDQPEQQEYLRLQLRHQLRLACRAFQEARAHDADADARAERAKADHQADADARVGLDHRDELHLVHCFLPFGLCMEAGDEYAVSDARAPSRCTRRSAS